MAKEGVGNLKVRWITLRLIERFKNVLYPIDIPMLLRLLPSIGYVVRAKTLKGVLEAGEPLATKGNIELLINQDNKTLGVEGSDILEVINGFNELRKLWLEKLDPSPGTETHYVEVIARGIIKSTWNPTAAFTKFWSQFDRMPKLNKIVGFDVANFGIRLVPVNMDPNAINWFDLRVEPQVISSANHLFIDVIWRNEDIGKIIKSFKNLDEMVKAIVREVGKT